MTVHDANSIASDDAFWREFKRSTRGMMPIKTYAEYRRMAAEFSQASIIDIGVGRGASSISFAMGIRDSGRNSRVHAIDIFSQLSAEGPHRFNKAENPGNVVEMNVGEVEENARRYGVADLIVIWPRPAEEVAKLFPPDEKIDILTIDVDGNIDRELRCFFDRVDNDGFIIIDDYGDFVDKRGKAKIGEMRSRSEAEIREWAAGIGVSGRRRLLGKHIFIYRLANLFEEMGLLKREQIVEWTAFYRKATAKSFREFDLTAISAVERSILNDFVEACRS